ncbi:hypothetical protein BDF20DRAFT_824886 [Mycotypha africana]|uniref:uncharacterized protein n=1 Tax=Mycotypha africana TaxID=64632 RepID=UPI00230107BA|nr:uncharacterized protein BDF20DRAFT_824886 [Mycotypha africana]KAI8971542.1 hypothetical protein BDF20DRAFT_824886 [Mycotypha africana]
MFSDFIVAASDEIIETRSTDSMILLKNSWTNWVSIVDKGMNISIDYRYDNWHIFDKRLRVEKLLTITSTPSADESISTPSSAKDTISNKSSQRLAFRFRTTIRFKSLGSYDWLENRQTGLHTERS